MLDDAINVHGVYGVVDTALADDASPRQRGVAGVQPPYHRNVRIEHNLFRVAGPVLLSAKRVEGLHFVDNTIVAADPGAAMPRMPSFILGESADVTIVRNRIELPQKATIEQTTPTVRLVVRDNTGLTGN